MWYGLFAFWGTMGLLAGLVPLVANEISFNRDVRPILSNKCFYCHGTDEETREGGLRLDVREDAVAAREGGAAIVPGNPDASLMVHRITAPSADDLMPPPKAKKPLTEKEKAVLREWIGAGAPYERHWAFREVRKPSVPQSALTEAEDENAIDAFVGQQLSEKGIEPLGEADGTTLMRRAYLDLVGVVPPLEMIDDLAKDGRLQSYERLLDRLLASPLYGERWGRHWLDQARYADSDGYAPDGNRSMWPYRDWVIKAFNEDKSFDDFTVEQLAGDLLENPTKDQLIATGFHRNTLINTEGGTDAEQFRNEAVVDRTNTTGGVWMGLTLGCAQCHAHKFDPITHEEYYQFFAFFNNSEDRNSRNPQLTLRSAEDEAELDRLRKNLKAFKQEHGENSERKKEIEQREKELRAFERRAPTTMIMGDRKKDPRSTHVLIRGDFLREGEEVEPEVPSWLPPLARIESDRSRNRLDLARWLVDSRNPLTARVTVNRLWMHHFGLGLVETENDFGFQGTLPTHPDLLDWLASEWMTNGWSMKWLHRTIMLSAVYRRDSRQSVELVGRDPLNKWLGRQNRPRVEAEIVRDLALSASGLLSREIGGPSVYPPQPAGIYAFTQNKKSWKENQGADRYRRGMYTFFYRSAPHPMLATFDTPNFQALCTRRERSNTPLQSLQLANDRMFIEMARGLGQRVLAEAADRPLKDQLTHAFRLCLTRVPDPEELETLRAFHERQREVYAADSDGASEVAGELPDWQWTVSGHEAAAWTATARVLLNLDEFVSRD